MIIMFLKRLTLLFFCFAFSDSIVTDLVVPKSGFFEMDFDRSHIVYSSESGIFLYNRNKKTTSKLFNLSINTPVIPKIYQNKVFFHTLEGEFCCVDFDGNIVFNVRAEISLGSIFINDNLILFFSDTQELFCYSMDGKLLWSCNKFLYSFLLKSNTIIFKDKEIYILTHNGFSKIDHRSGEVLNYQYFDNLKGAFKMQNLFVIFDQFNFYLIEENGKIVKYKTKDFFHNHYNLAINEDFDFSYLNKGFAFINNIIEYKFLFFKINKFKFSEIINLSKKETKKLDYPVEKIWVSGKEILIFDGKNIRLLNI